MVVDVVDCFEDFDFVFLDDVYFGFEIVFGEEEFVWIKFFCEVGDGVFLSFVGFEFGFYVEFV